MSLVEYTLIRTNRGPLSLGQLWRLPDLTGYLAVTKLHECAITGCKSTSTAPTLRVLIENGMTLRGTADQMVRLIAGDESTCSWKRLDALLENDLVAFMTRTCQGVPSFRGMMVINVREAATVEAFDLETVAKQMIANGILVRTK